MNRTVVVIHYTVGRERLELPATILGNLDFHELDRECERIVLETAGDQAVFECWTVVEEGVETFPPTVVD